MARRHTLERSFEEEAIAAGLIVKQPKSIRIDKSVENSGGKKGKVITTPDFFVVNTDNKVRTYFLGLHSIKQTALQYHHQQ